MVCTPILLLLSFGVLCSAGRRSLYENLLGDLSVNIQEHQDSPRGSMASTCEPFPGKRVVLVTVNGEFLDMFKNWLHYATKVLQDTEHLHVVAEDEAAVEPLKIILENQPIEYTLASPPAAKSLLQFPFMSDGYGKLVWERPAHILDLVEKGCSVLYADVDAVWAKDPFLDIGAAGSGDMHLTDDDPHPNANLCTCFMYFQPTDAVKNFIHKWVSHAGEENKNQKQFNKELQISRKEGGGPKVVTLPFDNFPPGNFADKHTNATVFHANWRVGVPDKVKFLKGFKLWNA